METHEQKRGASFFEIDFSVTGQHRVVQCVVGGASRIGSDQDIYSPIAIVIIGLEYA